MHLSMKLTTVLIDYKDDEGSPTLMNKDYCTPHFDCSGSLKDHLQHDASTPIRPFFKEVKRDGHARH